MKKFIVFALLFTVLTGSAFAQLVFSGSVHAGIELEIPYDTSEDETINAHHRREGVPQFNFIASITRENFGARLDTTFRADLAGDESLTVNGIYGWVDFLDNSLRLTMGRISSPLWVANLDPDNEFYFDKITGFRIQYSTPIPGLSVGAAFRTEANDLQQLIERTIFGATYMHPLFNMVFAYNMGGNAHSLFVFNYTGIPDLTSAGIQVRATNLASWDDPGFGGVLEVKQKLAYRVTRPLTVSLLTGQTVFADPGVGFENRPTELFFTPGISYRVNPSLVASFTTEFRSLDYFDNSRLITFTPSIEYTLRGNAVFFAEYEFRLGRYRSESHHRISFGIDVRAF